MTFTLLKERDGDEVKIKLNAEFVIPYEGNSLWIEELKEFINKQSV